MPSTADSNEGTEENEKANVFSKPWGNSDVVLVVEDKEFHVHRCILSLQSPVFSTMFNGNFKDSTQDKIELKDKHEAMSLFLQLLYPANMLNENNGKADINNENVLSIVELADKYGAKNVIKQCLTHIEHFEPENTMRLLPYAVRSELPVEEILDIIARHISTDNLESFAPKLDNESVHIKTLVTKCRVQENTIQRANTVMLYLLKKYVTEKNKTSVECVEHNNLNVQDFQKARKCKNCLMTYKKHFIDKFIQKQPDYRSGGQPFKTSEELIELLGVADDIATSLQK